VAIRRDVRRQGLAMLRSRFTGAHELGISNEPGSLAITVGFSALQSGSHRICSPALHRKMLIVDICPVSAATSSEYRYRVPKSAIERSQSWRKPRPPKFDGPAVAGQAQGNAETGARGQTSTLRRRCSASE
jgi:hypothetical protein